eukprot:GHUV01027004.1.p1 GENE.GHUV01027004.1~~GHUV01027004.1.p1  ORF type:complete len:129 (-),score=10.14 GHUV01027004.1:132-518(-)
MRSSTALSLISTLQEFRQVVYISCNPETLAKNLRSVTDTHDIVRFAGRFSWRSASIAVAGHTRCTTVLGPVHLTCLALQEPVDGQLRVWCLCAWRVLHSVAVCWLTSDMAAAGLRAASCSCKGGMQVR